MARYLIDGGFVCDGTVGKNGANDAGDVALVQLALSVLTRGFTRWVVENPRNPPVQKHFKLSVANQGPILSTGQYTGVTEAYILAYQQLPRGNRPKISPTGTFLPNADIGGGMPPVGDWNVWELLFDANLGQYPVWTDSRLAQLIRDSSETSLWLRGHFYSKGSARKYD
jgi:hypothetical protein